MSGKTIGLTTGQAARYCLVSPDTIVKWIKAENLSAQRTIGGQFRIFVDDLRQFMARNGMSTDLLDAELDVRPYCWQDHPGGTGETAEPEFPCVACPVFRAKALDCFELRAIEVEGNWACSDCESCDYYRRWSKPSPDGGSAGNGQAGPAAAKP